MGPTSAQFPSDSAHASDGRPAGSLTDFPAALIEITLERVIASDTFRRTLRHRQFLIHVVRAGLACDH